MATGRPRKFKTVFTAATYEYLKQFELAGKGDEVEKIQKTKENKHGRVTSFREVIPTLEGLGLYLNRSVALIKSYCKQNENFKEAVIMVEMTQASKLLTYGLTNEFNGGIAKLILGKHGYVGKEEIVNIPEKPELGKKQREALDKIMKDNEEPKK